ncbi:MAG TPA: hypothetical protein VE953_27285 [Terriglobales bacterium]|nr:hypothetical protein [Terriglobales bacterium]
MSEIPREELSATLAARHELGPEYDTALVDSLADRVEQVVQARVAAHQVTAAPPQPYVQGPPTALSASQRLAVAAISLGVAIPCVAIAGGEAGVVGVVVTWAGIAAVNLAAAINLGRGRQ